MVRACWDVFGLHRSGRGHFRVEIPDAALHPLAAQAETRRVLLADAGGPGARATAEPYRELWGPTVYKYLLIW